MLSSYMHVHTSSSAVRAAHLHAAVIRHPCLDKNWL